MNLSDSATWKYRNLTLINRLITIILFLWCNNVIDASNIYRESVTLSVFDLNTNPVSNNRKHEENVKVYCRSDGVKFVGFYLGFF